MRQAPDSNCGSSQHPNDDSRQPVDGRSSGGLEKAMASRAPPTTRIRPEPPTGHDSNGYRSGWPTGFRRDRYVDQVKRALTPLEAAHGALFESVLIQGTPGCGKRTIALRAAEEICSRDRRTLLVVNGRTFETFVASYLNTYHALTGSHLPAGEHWFYALYNLKHYLDNHRTQWLMVILDIDRYLDKVLDDPGRTLAWFLPHRGQIIMTGTGYYTLRATSRIRAAVNATLVPVTILKHSEVREFARHCCPELLALKDVYRGMMGVLGHTPLSLTIIAANLMLLDMTFQSYHRLFAVRDRERRRSLKKAETWLFDPEHLHRDILWETLANRDRWSVRLLAALTFVDAWEVPLELVGRLPVFRDTISDRLSPALALLQSLNILRVSEEYIWVDPTLHAWLRDYVFKKYDLQEWMVLRSQWAAVLTDALADRERRVGAFYACWMLGPHVHILDEEIMRHSDWNDLKLLEFLSKAASVAVFRAQVLKHAQTCIRHAQSLPIILSTTMQNVENVRAYNYAQAYVRLASAVVYADGPGELNRAETELRSAKLYIGRLKTHERYQQMLESSWLIELHIILCQNKPAHAEGFVDVLLTSDHLISERTRSKLHHVMAQCLDEQGIHAAAMQHSHEAMSHWIHRMNSLRSPIKTRTAIMVAETHVNMLIRLRKYRGALLFILPLLDLKITNAPQHSPSVWKLAKQAVMCYAALHDVEQAEKLVYRVLCSTTDGGLKEGIMYEIAYDIPDEFVQHYFDMLYHMAGLYLRKGRIIEADGLLRYILGVGSPRLLKNGSVPSVWWQDLMMCLYLRNDLISLAQVSAEYRQVYAVDFTIRDMDDLVAGIKQTTSLYQRALWAAEDGWLDDWKECVLTSDQRRLQFTIAQDLFGNPAQRVEEGRDFASDVGSVAVTRAKRSKLLHLVGFDVVDLVYVSKLAALPPTRAVQDEIFNEIEAATVFPNTERTSRAVAEQLLLQPGTAGEDNKADDQDSNATDTGEAAGKQKVSAEDNEGKIQVADRGTNTDELDGSGSEQQTCASGSSAKEGPATMLTPPKPTKVENTKQAFDAFTATAGPSQHREDNPMPTTFISEPPNTRPEEAKRGWFNRNEQDAHVFKLHIMEIWANPHHQRTLPQYWRWCYCRRHRSRSGSINPVDLIDKRFLREIAQTLDENEKPKLVQKKMTDCFLLLPPESKPLPPPGCHKNCPCHEANEQGAKEWAELLRSLRLWPEDDPAPNPRAYSANAVYTGQPRPNHRFIRPLRPPPALLLNEVFICEDLPRGEYIYTPPASDNGNLDISDPDSSGVGGGGGGGTHANLPTSTAAPPPPAQSSSSPTFSPTSPAPFGSRATSPRPEPRPEPPNGNTIARSPQLGTTWTWLQPELTPGDHPSENYLIRNSLYLPRLSVTLAEDSWALDGTPYEKLWYWKPVSAEEWDDFLADDDVNEEIFGSDGSENKGKGDDKAKKEEEEEEPKKEEEEQEVQFPEMKLNGSASASASASASQSEPGTRKHNGQKVIEVRVLTKRKVSIDEYFKHERRFTAKTLREQEQKCNDRQRRPTRLQAIWEDEEVVVVEAESG